MQCALIGCGKMGSAVARGLKKDIHWVTVSRKEADAQKLAEELGGSALPSIQVTEELWSSHFLFLAVKPNQVATVAKDLEKVDPKIPLVSVVGGMRLQQLKEIFGERPVARILPNLPVEIGEGVVALAKGSAQERELERLVQPLGLVAPLEEEGLEALSALAGSGPAFVCLILEAFIEAGIHMGLKPDLAKRLACQTLIGTSLQVKGNAGHPGQLKWEVCSPAGTSIAGLVTMEEQGVRSGIIQGILKTRARAE